MRTFIFTILVLTISQGFAQTLKPGFDKDEYTKLMLISVQSTQTEEYINKYAKPASHRMIYQSEDIGLDNAWDLWINDEKQAVISIRGTTPKLESWLENFYAGMIPSKGTVTLSTGEQVDYDFADHPKAFVHSGWTIGTVYLMQEILPRMDELYKEGIKDFLIIGHSQGGGIAYLLTANFWQMRKKGELPSDLVFKTYCSAAPKPGNLYFAYDYERNIEDGWAFNVVNAYDWVPEVPISIQTVDDFNPVNPFVNAKSSIKKQSFPQRLAMAHIYRKLKNPPMRATKQYEKYLGKKVGSYAEKTLPGLELPASSNSFNYMRCGRFITLMPDEEYEESFQQKSPDEIFTHHLHQPYLHLVNKQFSE